ncbi:MAG: hypothetical protein ACK55K_00070 [Bacteroidota bacterium]
MKYFATLFDINYLSRGVALYESLRKHEDLFMLYVLCLDNETHQYFNDRHEQYKHIQAIPLTDLENFDQDLLEAKTNRSKVEYYFTISPCLPLFLLRQFNLPHICTLDADILFYDSTDSIFNHLENHSIIITPHNFSESIKKLDKHGLYNVSFQIFKNDKWGIDCLEDWRKKCINWCKDILDLENQRFCDQLYLNDWPANYGEKLYVINNTGAGLAPWNLNNYKIYQQDQLFWVNQSRLIYFHFHGFKILGEKFATNGFRTYSVKENQHILALYKNYWEILESINNTLNKTNDTLIRYKTKTSLISRIMTEKSVFYIKNNKISNLKIFLIPRFLRSMIKRIYG